MKKQTTIFIALMICAPLFAMDEPNQNPNLIRILVPGSTAHEALDSDNIDTYTTSSFSELMQQQFAANNDYQLARIETEDPEDNRTYTHYVDGDSITSHTNSVLSRYRLINPNNRLPITALSFYRISRENPHQATFSRNVRMFTSPPPGWREPYQTNAVVPRLSRMDDQGDYNYGICTTSEPLPECSKRNFVNTYSCLLCIWYPLCLDSLHLPWDIVSAPCGGYKNIGILTKKLVCKEQYHMKTCCGCPI